MRRFHAAAIATAGLGLISVLAFTMPANATAMLADADPTDTSQPTETAGPTVPADEVPDDGTADVEEEPGSAVELPQLPEVTAHPGFRCPPDTSYVITKVATVRMRYKGVPKFKNGPGPLTMTVSRAYSGSVTYQVSAGAETEVGAILAKAKVKVDVSLSKSDTTTNTNSVTLSVPRNKYGNLTYVNWGKKIYWAKYVDQPNCSVKKTTGIISFPTNDEGWYAQITAN